MHPLHHSAEHIWRKMYGFLTNKRRSTSDVLMTIGILFISRPFLRIITSDFPREKYRRRRGEEKTALHWGQRKLLMSEIEFLTPYYHEGGVMIYAGAAPGKHCYRLAEMFPNFEFHWVDPSPFNCKEHPRITLDQNFFTDELAYKLKEKYKDKKRFFVSDIRTGNWKSMNEDEHEMCVSKCSPFRCTLI